MTGASEPVSTRATVPNKSEHTLRDGFEGM